MESRPTAVRGWAACWLSLLCLAAVADEPVVESPITEADRSHWAFVPPVRPALPAVRHAQWLRSPVDAFVLARLEEKGSRPATEAPRTALLRRLSFDLQGLPPTPEELAAFETATTPDFYEREIDRLLASPAFGQHLGQSWLDLARFAETDGFEHDKVRPNAWRYRDWVIAALNADLPYDEFVRLQIAGDEMVSGSKFQVPSSKPESKAEAVTSNLEPGTWNSPIPTMFCLAGSDMPDLNDQLERRHVLLNELTATVGAVFLGLQLGCAQCHDHKYDPLSQADFYRLRAVFELAVAVLKRDVPFNTLAQQPDAAPARFWIRGDHRRPGPEIEPGFPRIASSALTRSDNERVPDAAAPSSLAPRVDRRGQLADWLMRGDNPLTSRVMANRLWQHHFGSGLCQTPSDFGVLGGPVTHPDLLDWLAVEFRERGWGMKRLHRMLLSSAAYRQNSEFRIQNSKLRRTNEPTLAKTEPPSQPAADLLGCYPRRRLEGEAIRDAMLAVAGLLSRESGGPGVMPPLPAELLGTLLKGQWSVSQREAEHYKRSIYVFARRNLRYPVFEAFDRPDANATCPQRNESTTAPQSLLLFNSEFSLLVAKHLAARIMTAASDPPAQTEQLYQIALARRPTPREVETLTRFLAAERQRLATEGRPRDELALPANCPASADPYAAASLVDACLAILNSNEFIYLD